ncbi:MAG TPA: hypothetical protein EYP61_07080 [Candidatus Latescibacteria bacterium]|nr:hypothetical protein [Candidatus Latescibacterota bacterium]
MGGKLCIILVPEDGRPVVRIKVSWRKFLALIVSLLVFASAGLGGYWWAFKQGTRARRLAEENARLREENRKVGELSRVLAEVQEVRRRLVVALGGRELEDSSEVVLLHRPRAGEEPVSPSLIPEAIAAARRIARFRPSIWPVPGWISRHFEEGHEGIDIAGVRGDTVRAAADGTVAFAGDMGDLGLCVVLKHGKRYRTVYGHCDKLLAGKGQEVRKGQAIALLGSTGRSTGVHLHYEVWEDGKAVDPEKFLTDR